MVGPDSWDVLATAEQEGERRIFVDGTAVSELYENTLGPIVFSASDRFHVLAQRADEAFLVEGTLAEA